jgi:hypothetical protein
MPFESHLLLPGGRGSLPALGAEMRDQPVRTPAVRERVHIEGQEGTFLVIWADRESRTAQVVPLVDGDEVFFVPFALIRPVDESAADASADA